MSMSNKKLQKELRAEGASVEQARELSAIAGRLSVLAIKPSVAADGHSGRLGGYFARVAVGSLALTAVLFGLVAVSMNTIPGQPLHGLKSASESLATDLVPALHTDVMMDKSWEVEQLVSQHKASTQVLATLASYNQEYVLAKGGRYAARDYCSKELIQASKESNGAERAAINASLAQVEDNDS
jgi:hypothetical protein